MIDQSTKDDDATFSCVVGKDVTSCEVFVQGLKCCLVANVLVL